MKSWYRITNLADSAEIYLFDEVGAWGTSANDFVKELRDVKASTIDLHVNSPGGDVFDGIAIFNALRNHKASITVHIDGLAASAASFIAQAGDRRVMARNAEIMIHEAHGVAVGNTKDMAGMADLLDKYSDKIADIYAERAGGTVAQWRDRMRTETWYSADEAVKAGLADEVVTTAKRPANSSWDLTVFNFAGRDKAPDPFPTVVDQEAPPVVEPPPIPPPTTTTENPADEPGFFMPPLDLARIRDAVESLNEIPFAAGLITAAVSLGANDCPTPDVPAPPAPAPPGPDLSINLPGLRRAIREAQL